MENLILGKMNLFLAFRDSVSRHAAKIAIFWGEREYSYEQLLQLSHRLAGDLAAAYGIRPGSRVGLWLKNCPEFIPAFFGILESGAVVVPINNFLKAEEVGYMLNDAGVDVVVTDHELGTHHRAIEALRPGVKFYRVENFTNSTHLGPRLSGDGVAAPKVGESDLAVIIYTSGTTGKPKGAMLSHGNLLHNTESCRVVLKTVDSDRFVVLLPLFHSYMLTVGMLLPLLVGGSMVLVKSLHPVRAVLQEIIERGATTLPAIPQFYRSMVNASIPVPLPLRLCVSGAAPLPAQVLAEFEVKFHIPLIEGYGLSEASPVVTKNPLDGTRKPGSIGLPIYDVEVSIQDEAGTHLSAGQVGEVCVRGKNVMMGYWNQPNETAKVMRDGWLLTGDVGYRDEQGYYYITDRKKDMLLVNGINVYPREIEEVLYQHPGVKEAAVVGFPDPRRGEQPIAFVAANEGQSLEELPLLLFVRRKLADYKVPRKVVILQALPRNATGKILKTALRKMLEAETAAVS